MDRQNQTQDNQQTPGDRNIDVTRSQNRNAVSAEHGDMDRMGTGSEATGSRPSNDNRDNLQTQPTSNPQTGSHGEGQYPRNAETPSDSEFERTSDNV